MCTRFNRVLAWSFIVPFSLNVIRYFAPSNIELCRHGGDRERIKLVRTVGTGSVFTRRELRTRRLEVWNLLATRCSPLWTEFFERDDPIKISGFGKKYANRGPALNYLKLPRENSMPSNSFLFFFSPPYILHASLYGNSSRNLFRPLILSIRLRFFGQDSRDFLIVHGGKLSCEELIKK